MPEEHVLLLDPKKHVHVFLNFFSCFHINVENRRAVLVFVLVLGP